MANPFPFVAGDVLTAAELNDIGNYTVFTPTFVNFTIGNGTTNFVFTQINKFVHIFGQAVLGSTSTMGSFPVMALPVNRSAISIPNIGTGNFTDSGVATHLMFPIATNATSVTLFATTSSGANIIERSVTATQPFTWGTGDGFQVNLTYRAA